MESITKPINARIQLAARSRGVNRNQIYNWINEGSVIAYKVGRGTLVDLVSLDARIERGRIEQFPLREEMRRRRLAKAKRLAAANNLRQNESAAA